MNHLVFIAGKEHSHGQLPQKNWHLMSSHPNLARGNLFSCPSPQVPFPKRSWRTQCPLYTQSQQLGGYGTYPWDGKMSFTSFLCSIRSRDFEPKFPKSQQHALANGLCCSPELPNQLFTLIEAWPTLGIQPGTRGARSSQHPSSLRAGCRSGYAAHGWILRVLKDTHRSSAILACPKTPSSSKPSFAARCQICTSLNRAPSLPCAGIGEMGLRYACNFHTLLLYVPDSVDNNVPCIRPTTGKTFPAPRLHLNPSDPGRCPSTENEQNCPGI